MKQDNPALKYGLIGAIVMVAVGIVMQLMAVSYLEKVSAEPETFSAGKSILFSIISLLIIVGIFIFCIVKAIKDYRRTNPEYTYRKMVAQGLLVTLIIVLVSAGISYIYNTFITPEAKEKTIEYTKLIYENMEMPEETREKAIEKLNNPNPVREMVTSIGLTLLLGMIISLITATVMNRRDIQNPNQLR